MKGVIKKIKASRKQILITVLISSVAGILVYLFKPNTIKLPFPHTTKPFTEYQYSCEALVGSFIRGGDTVFEKGVFAEVYKGTDKIAIEVEEDKMYFLTQASVGIGTAKGEAWVIVKNTEDRLIAIYNGLDERSGDFNLFIINKTNGIAVWTKTNSDLFGTNNPAVQSYYLICK